jgi:D-alanyl-D-alanine dipeptidase
MDTPQEAVDSAEAELRDLVHERVRDVDIKSAHGRRSNVDLRLYRIGTGDLAPMGGPHDLMDSVSLPVHRASLRPRRPTVSCSCRSCKG